MKRKLVVSEFFGFKKQKTGITLGQFKHRIGLNISQSIEFENKLAPKIKAFGTKFEPISCQYCTTSVDDVKTTQDRAFVYVCDSSHILCTTCIVTILLGQICPCAIQGSSSASAIWKRREKPDLWFMTMWKLGKECKFGKESTSVDIKTCQECLIQTCQEKYFGHLLFPSGTRVSTVPRYTINLADDENGNDDVPILPTNKIDYVFEDKQLASMPLSNTMCSCFHGISKNDALSVHQWILGMKPIDGRLWESSLAQYNKHVKKETIKIPCLLFCNGTIDLKYSIADMGKLTFVYVLQCILRHIFQECTSKTFCGYCDDELGILPEDNKFTSHAQLLRHIIDKH